MKHVGNFHSVMFHANVLQQNFVGINQDNANIFPNDDLPNDFNDDVYQPGYNPITLDVPKESVMVDAVTQTTKLVFFSQR